MVALGRIGAAPRREGLPGTKRPSFPQSSRLVTVAAAVVGGHADSVVVARIASATSASQ